MSDKTLLRRLREPTREDVLETENKVLREHLEKAGRTEMSENKGMTTFDVFMVICWISFAIVLGAVLIDRIYGTRLDNLCHLHYPECIVESTP